jgi:hypothetical protein
MRTHVIGLVAAFAGTALFCKALYAQGNEPRILALSPSSVPVGSGEITLIVNGERFGNAGQNVVVRWNRDNRATTYVSETQLRVTILATDLDSAGIMEVTVHLPLGGGMTSAPAAFSVNNPLPTISALSSTAKVAGSPAFVLTVTGTRFAPGAAVHWNGAARTTSRVSATRLTANLSATDLAAAGNYKVTVVNPAPGGGASMPLTFSVVDSTRITAFYIGGPHNPRRVWAGSPVPLEVTRAGGTPTLWRVAASASALPTTAWQSFTGVAPYTFAPWRANDCGLTDPAQFRHSAELYFQYGAIIGGDTITSTSASDSVIVRLPWCSPITVNPPVASAGDVTSTFGRSICPLGTLMTGVRAGTHTTTVLGSTHTYVSAVGAICGSSDAPLIGSTLGDMTVTNFFGSRSAPSVQVSSGTLATLRDIKVLSSPLPASLEDGVSYPPLYSRVIDGTVSSGSPWTIKCPSGTAPIGMYVYHVRGVPTGLSLLCVRPDN